jgi:RHS repeat-associated protein
MKRHDYLPFGEEIGLIGGRTGLKGFMNDGTRQKFTGYERDWETRLNFARARFQQDEQGRFTSIDPLLASAHLTDPQSLNRYSYALNDPSNLYDPDGLMAADATQSWTDVGGMFWGSSFDFRSSHFAGHGVFGAAMMQQDAEIGDRKKEKTLRTPGPIYQDGSDIPVIVTDSFAFHSEAEYVEYFRKRLKIPDRLKGFLFHLVRQAQRAHTQLPDGITASGSALFVFSGQITITKDLHVLGGVSTPNVAEIVRTGLKGTRLRLVPLSGSVVATHILGETTEAQRQSFFSGTDYRVSGGYIAYGSLTFSGNRVGISSGYGHGVDIGSSHSWPIFTPQAVFENGRGRLERFIQAH